MKNIVILLLLFSSFSVLGQKTFPKDHEIIDVNEFCELFSDSLISSLVRGFTFNNQSYPYQELLLMARLHNTVILNGHLIKSYTHVICERFSMDDGIWRRFYYFMDDFWADDNLYYRNGLLYLKDSLGKETFPFYRLSAEAESEFFDEKKENRNRQIAKDSLINLGKLTPKEFLREFNLDTLGTIVDYTFILDNRIYKNDSSKDFISVELQRQIAKMKVGNHLIVKEISFLSYDPNTFELLEKSIGPFIYEVIKKEQD